MDEQTWTNAMGARNRHRLEHCSICALRGPVTQSAPEPPCRCHCEASMSLCPFLDPALSIGGDGCRLFFSSSSLLSLSLYGRPPPSPSISSVICARLPQARGKPKTEKKKTRDKRDHKANGTTQQLARLTVAFRTPSPVEREALRCASRGASERWRRVSVIMLVSRKAVPVSVWTDALRMLRSYGQVSPQSRIRRVAAPCSPAGLTQTGPVSHHGTNAQCQMANGDHPCARWCCHTDGRWHCINLPCYVLLLVLVNAGSKKQRLF
ncbi:hypothetical protein V8C34DRAFT_65063 [Trichoderma compactum]